MSVDARDRLVAAAREVAAHAYAPLSKFPVGAAVLADDGRIFAGCNVENASYGLTMCAERNAVAQAVAGGARRVVAAAVVTPLAEPASPCGACRQVLYEFGAEMTIWLAGSGTDVVATSIEELLPRPFRFARGPA